MKRLLLSYKNAYSGFPQEIWVLFSLTIINRMGTMVFPFLTIYLTTILGFPLEQAGIMAGSWGFGALVGSFLGGKLSDQMGVRLIIIATLTVNGFVLIILSFSTSMAVLLGLIFIAGLFGEAYRPAVMASVGDFVKKEATGRSMSLIRLAISLGMSAAPAIGGFVAVSLGYRWIFWIDGSTCIVAALYFWYASRFWRTDTGISIKDKPQNKSDISKPPYRNINYLLFLLATFIMGFGFIQWYYTVPVFIKSEWGFDERYIGVLMGMHSLLICLFELPVIHSIERANRIKNSVLAGIIFISISFLPFLLPGAFLYCIIAMLLFTMSSIFYFPFNNAIPVHMSPGNRRGEYMAWYWMTWSLTNIAGPVIGLAFVEVFGFSLFWIFISLFVGLSLLLNKLLAKRIII